MNTRNTASAIEMAFERGALARRTLTTVAGGESFKFDPKGGVGSTIAGIVVQWDGVSDDGDFTRYVTVLNTDAEVVAFMRGLSGNLGERMSSP